MVTVTVDMGGAGVDVEADVEDGVEDDVALAEVVGRGVVAGTGVVGAGVIGPAHSCSAHPPDLPICCCRRLRCEDTPRITRRQSPCTSQ